MIRGVLLMPCDHISYAKGPGTQRWNILQEPRSQFLVLGSSKDIRVADSSVDNFMII
jgi:hypothetical protein